MIDIKTINCPNGRSISIEVKAGPENDLQYVRFVMRQRGKAPQSIIIPASKFETVTDALTKVTQMLSVPKRSC